MVLNSGLQSVSQRRPVNRNVFREQPHIVPEEVLDGDFALYLFSFMLSTHTALASIPSSVRGSLDSLPADTPQVTASLVQRL